MLSRLFPDTGTRCEALELHAEHAEHAEHAGSALACTFSSSAEFEAALIAARRAAGVYGPRRHRKQMLTIAAAIVAGLATVVFLIV